MNEHIDLVAKGAMGTGVSSGLVVWGLQLPEWAALTSIAVALAGLIIHVIVVMRKDRRAEELHRSTLEAMRVGKNALSLRGGEDSSSDSEG